ncbi:MAG: amidase [Woeseiaceae bacterium]
MPDTASLPENPLYWPISELVAAYERRELSPVGVLEHALARIDALNPTLHAFIGRLDELGRAQAKAAEQSYQRGDAGPFSGVPVSIKDTFQIDGEVTTFGSLVYQSSVSSHDSGIVRRLKAAGAVFTGRSNTAEFGQSATTENRFFADVCNPWDITRTTGGSSGGAAASVLAGLSSIGLGADGGGSVRIPAAFAGLFGFKSTYGLCKNEKGFAAMSDFICPGPLSWCVADARRMQSVLAEQSYSRGSCGSRLRIAWCAHPEARPTDPVIDAVLQSAINELAALGHRIDEFNLPLQGWDEVFGPLVLAEEWRERGHLLESADLLTDYERKSLEAAKRVTEEDLKIARAGHSEYRRQIQVVFEDFDFVIAPTTAVTPFVIGEAPKYINGQRVTRTWGAYPFTAPFNVSGNPAATIPCGFANSLPVGLQLIGPMHADAELLDLAEDMESVLRYDRQSIIHKWALPDIDRQRAVSP